MNLPRARPESESPLYSPQWDLEHRENNDHSNKQIPAKDLCQKLFKPFYIYSIIYPHDNYTEVIFKISTDKDTEV